MRLPYLDSPPMNELPPESTPPEVTINPHKDRSTGLIVFGILTILMGCAAVLTVPLLIFGQVAFARSTGQPPSFETVLPVVAIYGPIATVLIWLGIGSIMARRWARALLLIFSWSWLGMGILMTISMMFFLPKIFANPPASTPGSSPPPAAAVGAAMFFMFFFMSFVFILLPAIWTFFYNSRHVKATCAVRDPVTRWTDACPLPVLGLCLWLLFAVPMMILMLLAGHVVMPFFGTFVTGVPGTLLSLAVAAFWVYAAWLLYKLDVRGWWLILIALCVLLASGLLTFAHHDMAEMYQLMGYPQAQIDQMQKMGIWSGKSMPYFMCFSMVPFLGYLIFVKKYLGGKRV